MMNYDISKLQSVKKYVVYSPNQRELYNRISFTRPFTIFLNLLPFTISLRSDQTAQLRQLS